MKTTKTIKRDVRGSHIEHEGVKYRPLIASAFKAGSDVEFRLPHQRSDDSYATVRQDGVTETWEPQV